MSTCVVMSSIRKAPYLERFQLYGNDTVHYVLIVDSKNGIKHSENVTIFTDEEVQTQYPWMESTRNYGVYWAYTQQFNHIICVDDDVIPMPDFFTKHLSILNSYTTLGFFDPCRLLGLTVPARGFPEDRPIYPIKFNCGLWLGDADVDAVDLQELESRRGEFPLVNRHLSASCHLPYKSYAPISGMNVAFPSEMALAYFYPGHYGRCEDIWAGLFIEKICHQLGYAMGFGEPVVYHVKGLRNVTRDVMSETKFREQNNRVWKWIRHTPLHGNTVRELMRCLAHMAPFSELREQMRHWIDLY